MIKYLEDVDISDIDIIAGIHKDQFNDHFLGKYSVGIIKAYYKEFIGNSLFLVYKEENTIKGFILGGQQANIKNSKDRFLKNNFFKLIMATLIKPDLYFQAFARLKERFIKKSIEENEKTTTDKIVYVILSIAVAKEFLGKGIAQALVNAFQERTGKVAEIQLYVKKSNKRAIRFYEKMGFSVLKISNEEYIYRL